MSWLLKRTVSFAMLAMLAVAASACAHGRHNRSSNNPGSDESPRDGGQYKGVVPPARDGVEYQKWDNICIRVSTFDFNESLKAAGEQGWELVGLTGGLACFRRPSEVGSPPDSSQESGADCNGASTSVGVSRRGSDKSGAADVVPRKSVYVEVGSPREVLELSFAGSSRTNRDRVRRNILAETKHIRDCAAKALASREKPGRIVLDIEVNAAGEIQDLRMPINELGEPLAKCLRQVLSQTTLPKLHGDTTRTVQVSARWHPVFAPKASPNGGVRQL